MPALLVPGTHRRRTHQVDPFTSSVLQSSGAHRDLHSFPTRRSSDLRDSLLDLGKRAHVRNLRDRVTPRNGIAPADRKSTRLNSSHVSISYAVSCLKKKQIEPAHTQPTTSMNHYAQNFSDLIERIPSH